MEKKSKQKRTQLSFSITEETKDLFLQYCKKNMYEKSVFLEHIINEYIKDKSSNNNKNG